MKILCWLLLFITGTAQAVTVQTTSRNCAPGLSEAAQTIARIAFPENWRVVLVCDPPTWDYLRRKADALATQGAFTNLKGRITVVNWEVFARPKVARPPKRVLLHELAHIICKCGDDGWAEKYAISREKQSQPGEFSTADRPDGPANVQVELSEGAATSHSEGHR